MCDFSDALLYVLDRNAEYRETFGKRGTGAIIAGTDADVIGIVASICGRTREEVAPTVKARAIESLSRAELFGALAVSFQKEGKIETALAYNTCSTLALENEKQAGEIKQLADENNNLTASINELYDPAHENLVENRIKIIKKTLADNGFNDELLSTRSNCKAPKIWYVRLFQDAGWLNKADRNQINLAGAEMLTFVRVKNRQAFAAGNEAGFNCLAVKSGFPLEKFDNAVIELFKQRFCSGYLF